MKMRFEKNVPSGGRSSRPQARDARLHNSLIHLTRLAFADGHHTKKYRQPRSASPCLRQGGNNCSQQASTAWHHSHTDFRHGHAQTNNRQTQCTDLVTCSPDKHRQIEENIPNATNPCPNRPILSMPALAYIALTRTCRYVLSFC